MNATQTFLEELNARIAKYDLLCHPFYKAWSEGKLTHDDLREYACDYYQHVAAFPEYLDKFQKRLPEGALRSQVIENKLEEEAPESRSHAEIWLDFAEGMGADRQAAKQHASITEMNELIAAFSKTAEFGSNAEAIAAFYAYESQVPRVAETKEKGLKEFYGADDRTAYYFKMHKTYDIKHSNTWFELLTSEIGNDAQKREDALNSAENAAKSLWKALDGVERERLARCANRN